jgi:hypothetical protein
MKPGKQPAKFNVDGWWNMNRMQARLLVLALMLTIPLVNHSQTQRRTPLTFTPEETSKKVTELKPGEASGTIKARGATVRLRYAYARWVKDTFNPNEQMISLWLTEKAIPKTKLAVVFAEPSSKSNLSYDWLGGALRGIRFALKKKDGFTYQAFPLHFDMSAGGGNGLDEFKLEEDRLSGADEERNHGIDDDRWGYSVSFVATISK